MSKTMPNDMQREDYRLLEQAPKAVLYAIAKHLAAMADDKADGYDGSLESGSYRQRIRAEWVALHANGIVTQKPPATVL